MPDRLGEIALFRELGRPARGVFERLARRVRAEPHGRITEPGGEASFVHLLVEGHAKACLTPLSGPPVILRLLGRGEACPLPLPQQAPGPALSLWALDPCVCLRWSSSVFAALVARHPPLLAGIAAMQAAWLADAEERLADISTKSVSGRLASALCRIGSRWGDRVAGAILLPFPVRGHDLADLIGATHFTVARLLSGWTRRGLLMRRGSRLVIPDMARLERAAGKGAVGRGCETGLAGPPPIHPSVREGPIR